MTDDRTSLMQALAEGGRVVGVELDRIDEADKSVHFRVTVQPPSTFEITLTIPAPRAEP